MTGKGFLLGVYNHGVGVHGVDVMVSRDLGTMREQYRFPRSKRWRIRKKWRKDPRNWRTRYVPTLMQVGERIYMDPDTYQLFQHAKGLNPQRSSLQWEVPDGE